MAKFVVPENVIIGQGVLYEARQIIGSLGKKAFIVTGKHIVKSKMMLELKSFLDECSVKYFVYDEITGEPTDKMISRGAALYKYQNCDFCIGIGGGSPLDSAKAIAVMAVSGGKITDYAGREIKGDIPPIAAIPTTSGTGSEATKFTVITDTEKDVKLLLKGDALVPKLALIDSLFTLSAPPTVTASTALDALTHAVESYTSRKAFSTTDALALSSVKRIMKYLPSAFKDGNDKKARAELSAAAFEAGICINNSSVTLVHGMSRPIGAIFHVPHGMSNAMLLGECLKFALSGAVEKFADLGYAVEAAERSDSAQTAAEKFIGAIENLCSVCKIPTLKEYGIDKKKYYSVIGKMADDAIASASPANTVKKVTVEDCIEIYKKLYP